MSDHKRPIDRRVLEIGARVVCVKDVDLDGFGTTLRAGTTGVVKEVAENNCMVLLDTPIEGAEDPANEFWTAGYTEDYADARDELAELFAFLGPRHDPKEGVPEGTMVVYDAHVVFEKGPDDEWTSRVMLAQNEPNVYEAGGITASEALYWWAKTVVESFAKDEYPITR